MNIWLAEIWRAWRASLRRPGFLLLAIGVLGLGVGASAAVFTLVDRVVLQPLPFSQPQQLVTIGLAMPGFEPIASTRQYQHLQALHDVASEGLLAIGSSPENVSAGDTPRRANALRFDRHLLPTLGLHPLIGRNFTAREDQPNGPPVALLSHGFWERAYGGNPNVIGRQLRVKGVAHTIVGVLPARFDAFCARFLRDCDIVLPTAVSPSGNDATIGFLVIARLGAGTTASAAGAEVNARMQQLYGASNDPNSAYMRQQKFVVANLASALHAGSESMLTLFAASALCVLLIAWVNLTNLLFLRTLARHRDGAVRAALGASWLRRHLPTFAESLFAGLFGGLLGVGLAMLGLAAFRHYVPPGWLGGGLAVTASTWWFALIVAIVAALLATLLGLWKGRRVDLAVELHEGGRSGGGARLGRLGRALVVVQVALAMVLLAGAGLFLHALVSASQAQLGFNPRGVLAMQLTPLKTRYPDAASVRALGERLRERLAALPGVVHADVSTGLPSNGSLILLGLHTDDGQRFSTNFVGADPGYFTTFAIPVLAGRAFTRMDRSGSELVAVVNEAFARTHFGGRALGRTIHMANPEPRTLRVVGVVGNTRQEGPFQPPPPILYVPWQQVGASQLAASGLHFALRVHGNPDAYRRSVRNAVADVAPLQPIARMIKVQDLVAGHISRAWLILLLVGLFAVLALLLAAAGIYAVMAVMVASREHEFGVRTALGASPIRLMRLVLRGGALQIVLGLAIGIAAAVLLSGTLKAFLAQIGRHSALDPWALAGVCFVLAIAGLLACLLPALRAGRVQPMHALRGE